LLTWSHAQDREVGKILAVEPKDIVVGYDRRSLRGEQGGQVAFIPANKNTGGMALGLDDGFVHGKPMGYLYEKLLFVHGYQELIG
jgi:hypothetical protein